MAQLLAPALQERGVQCMHLGESPTSLDASYPIFHILALALFLFPYLLFLISEIALTKSHAVEESSTTQWLPNIALQQTYR